MDGFDFVVIGAGAAGEAAAFAALERGRTVAVVERELVGGSCAFWACIPSKSLLHGATEHHHGYSWQQASDRRDYMINREHRDWPDDSGHVKALETAGAKMFRGVARITGPGRVEVRGSGAPAAITARTIIVATGSQPKIPDLDGLAETKPWTNREATSTRDLPKSMVVLGGGATGVELASVFARFGVETALVHSHDRLLDKDHALCSEAAARVLRDDGVELRLGARASRVRPAAGSNDSHVVELSDGGYVEGERILVALGRDFSSLGALGLETVGVDAGRLRPDGRLRIADDVYLIGDPAGPEQFTHVGHYQGGLAVRMALGENVTPDYHAIPRAVFTDPEIASVGMDVATAKAAGIDAFELVADFATTARGYELEAKFGHLAIVVDNSAGLLVGASVVAPDASAAIHETVLAIHARTPMPTLAGMIHAFPSTSRGFDGLYTQAIGRLRGVPVPA